MKAVELLPPELDYWVAIAEGETPERMDVWEGEAEPGEPPYVYLGCGYTIYWEQAGPIVGREKIALMVLEGQWRAILPGSMDYDPSESNLQATVATASASGPTPLIAAMRAYVLLKFGDGELPEHS